MVLRREILLSAWGCLFPIWARYILLPVRHSIALVTGSEHELLHQVTDTHDRLEIKGHSHSPSLKKFFLFLLYASCHIADSQLLANQSEDQDLDLLVVSRWIE